MNIHINVFAGVGILIIFLSKIEPQNVITKASLVQPHRLEVVSVKSKLNRIDKEEKRITNFHYSYESVKSATQIQW